MLNMSVVKVYKPTTAARRHTSVIDYSKSLTKGATVEKSLVIRKKRMGGRSNGKITTRHQGGGAKKLVRIINYKRNFAQGFKVLTVEYDPNRTAFISKVVDLSSGDKHYVIFTKGMEVGRTYQTKEEVGDGNQVRLSTVPVGGFVSQLEINPGQGAKMVRGAGTYAIITAREDKFVTVKLPSGEVRKLLGECTCVVNKVGNEAHSLVRLGKAGRVRHMGVRPTVRGKVMNPVDHPHGGGEARNSIGMKYPKTPWGKHALGVRTRNPKKASSGMIITRRKAKKAS
jgi:large subunit ribosomal protein L2